MIHIQYGKCVADLLRHTPYSQLIISDLFTHCDMILSSIFTKSTDSFCSIIFCFYSLITCSL